MLLVHITLDKGGLALFLLSHIQQEVRNYMRYCAKFKSKEIIVLFFNFGNCIWNDWKNKQLKNEQRVIKAREND